MPVRRRSRRGIASAVAVGAACMLCKARHHVARADDALNEDVEDAFSFAEKQLEFLADEVLSEQGVFTAYTDEDGAWITEKDDGETIDMTVWTSGMVAGMFWYQYEGTGLSTWETRAEYITEGLEGVEELDDNDLGFQVLNSFGHGWRLTSNTSLKEDYAERVLTGATSLYEYKWDGTIPAFWSWSEPSSRPEWELAVNIDMIMNTEIMLWASVNGGDEGYAANVANHADTSWSDLVRSDNSTFHVADYDPDTGELVDQGTYQGWRDNSTWSRGQAWAVYGFAMIYRYLEEPRFLEMSQGVFEYFHANLPEDLVPPADFDAPESATENGKDSSATAVVCSALFELFTLTEDPAYLLLGQEYLAALLSPDYYLPDATDGYQSILRRSSEKWGEPEVGAVFADYFLLEAMVRYKTLAPSILLWDEAGQEIGAGASERRRRLQTLSGGEFCAVQFSDGVLEFTDADCVPVAPDFSAVTEDGETPAPTPFDVEGGEAETPAPSPSSRGITGDGTPAPALVASASPSTPDVNATLSPSAEAPGTAAPAVSSVPPSPSGGTGSPVDDAATPAPSIASVAPGTSVPQPSAAPNTPVPTGAATSLATLALSTVQPAMMSTLPPALETPVPTPARTLVEEQSNASQAPSAVETSNGTTVTTGGTTLEFGALALDNDVSLAYLDPDGEVLVWLSITLNNTANTPATVVLTSSEGDSVEATVTEPSAGWGTGTNTVRFTLPTSALDGGEWDTVVSVSIVFTASSSTSDGEQTTFATIDYLVLSHELVIL